MLQSIFINLLWIIVAYLIGSINFSIILTRLSKNKNDIRTKGSKNAGATNAARIYGFKFGVLIFILDASKAYWFAFLLGCLQQNVIEFEKIIPQLATLFVIIGHIFPIYFNFKGGKGAATILGMIASISLILAAIGTVCFIVILLITRFISLGSIVVPYWLAALSFINPYFNGWYDSVIKYNDPFWITPLFLFIACIIVTISHYQNIIRIYQRKENQISLNFIEKYKNKNN